MRHLEHELLAMATAAESMVGRAIESLCTLDSRLAFEVLEADDEVDRFDQDIENRCLRMLALQQPVATDFRIVGSTLKIITDIERIGDLAVDIAKCGMKIEQELGSTDFIDLRKMGSAVRAMIAEAIDAFVRRDFPMVGSIRKREDEIDELYRELRRQIHGNMQSDPGQVVAASWVLLAIHHLERIADHALNIASRVDFIVSGRTKQSSTQPQAEAS
ncbi:MAG: Phosphate-specific transport system accessory protein PhoU [Fimbriimonadaceae bacterium]|nr:Phosphate-specific transport system accessory protein PhoU [Fimbriimonadaceae bacterium]